MAATNFTPIQLYFSTTASAVPTAANLAQGELAINITDGKLYYEDNAGAVQVIATKGAGTIGGSTTQIQYNNAGALAGNAAMVFNNSTNVTTLTTLNLTNALGAIYGGTAQSAYAQGDVLYASATNTLSKLGIGTVNYILTSTGTVPQWVAPSSIAVLTATNLDGGAAGSVPYQSGVATTTFLAIGAANRVMTSSGTAPQWVTSLTGLTGVSSSSITNTSLTSGRVVVSTTAGLQADDADLTFDGTTLSAGGFSTVGLSTLVKTVKIGDSSFNGVAVFAAATPAKLYMGTGTVTDVTSAISATNAVGAIASFGITPIAATNTSVTYTDAATLYIAGAPSAGTNVTLTNPYALYVAGGAAYFGGAVTVAGSLSLAAVTVTSLTDSGLTSGRVTYAGTGGLLQDSANLTFNGSALAITGTLSATGSINKINTAGATSQAFGSTGSTTGATYGLMTNTSGSLAFGVEASSASAIVTGSTAYAGVIYTTTNTPLQLGSNNNIYATISSAGLAVTGLVNIASGNWLQFGGANTLFSSSGVGFLLQAPDVSTTPLTIRGSGGANWATFSSTGLGVGTTTTTLGSINLAGSAALGITSATTGDYLSSGGGNNSTYNGIAILSNSRSINTQANTSLPSWIVDIGGRAADGSTYDPNTANKFRVAYVAAGGSYYNATNFFAITSAGNVGVNNISPTTRFAVTLGEGEASSMTSLSPGTGAVGYNQGEIRECSFNVDNTSNFVISSIVTTSSGWRVIFRGTWSNNFEGGSLASPPPYIEVNAANPSVIVGSRTLTVSRNGSGFLIVNTTDAYRIAFAGTVEIFENPQSVQPTQSMRLLGGIEFPATQNASSNANTLDDYEEGTWSPMMGDLSSNNFTMSIVDGRYTKIGNQVTASLIANWTSIGSVTSGGLRCTLPIACNGSNYARFSAAIGYMDGFDTVLGTKQITSNLDQGLAYLTFYQTNDNSAPTILPANSCSASGGFQATITYFV